MLDILGLSLESILEIDPDFLGDDEHVHNDSVRSFVIRSERPFDAERLQAFMCEAVGEHANNLTRYKGIVAVAGIEHRVVFQGVFMLMGSDIGRA